MPCSTQLPHQKIMAPVQVVPDDQTTSSFSVNKDTKKEELDVVIPSRIVTRRSVDFAMPPTVQEVERLDGEWRDDIWYTREEYDIIKARNSLIIKMMKTGNFQETDENSFRGLEHKLKDGFKERRANKFNALNAVLEEQERQHNRSYYDPDIIADSYRRVSMNALEKAFVTGLRDAEGSLCYHGPEVGAADPAEDNSSEELESDSDDMDTVYSDYSNMRNSSKARNTSNLDNNYRNNNYNYNYRSQNTYNYRNYNTGNDHNYTSTYNTYSMTNNYGTNAYTSSNNGYANQVTNRYITGHNGPAGGNGPTSPAPETTRPAAPSDNDEVNQSHNNHNNNNNNNNGSSGGSSMVKKLGRFRSLFGRRKSIQRRASIG